MSNVFDVAYNTVRNVDELVSLRIEDAALTSEALRDAALDTITALQSVNFNYSVGPLPSPPQINPRINVTLALPVITPTSFGGITSNEVDRPDLGDVPDVRPLDIEPFVSSISGLAIPNPPAWIAAPQEPTPPVIQEVEIPLPPVLVLPTPPALLDIQPPSFAGLNIPQLNATAPTFTETALPGAFQWAEPTYRTEILDEVLVKIRELWSGRLGIPEAVEDAIFERAMAREELIANREIDSVAEEFSSRGFTMPTGMQAARVDQMRQELTLKKMGANREFTIKIAEWQIENVRFGIQQAVAAENIFVNVFMNMAARMFEAAKFRVESLLNIYNAQIALYNARIAQFQAEAQVFEVRLRAELAKIEVFKAEVEAEIARGQINEQRVRAYVGMVQAVQTQVDIYKVYMQGAEIRSNVVRNRIDAYRAEVEAFAARIDAGRIQFDAYEALIKGEVAKAGIVDSEARAYAALVQGKASIADVDVKRADLMIQKNRSLIDAYLADLDFEKTRVAAQVSVIGAGAQAYVADTQRFSAQAGAETAKATLAVTAKEAEIRTNISFYQAQVQAYLGNMEQLIRQASLVVESLKSAGQISSTLAAGAMAGVSVGANLSGQGSVSAAGQSSFSTTQAETKTWSDSKNTNRNFNFEGTS